MHTADAVFHQFVLFIYFFQYPPLIPRARSTSPFAPSPGLSCLIQLPNSLRSTPASAMHGTPATFFAPFPCQFATFFLGLFSCMPLFFFSFTVSCAHSRRLPRRESLSLEFVCSLCGHFPLRVLRKAGIGKFVCLERFCFCERFFQADPE